MYIKLFAWKSVYYFNKTSAERYRSLVKVFGEYALAEQRLGADYIILKILTNMFTHSPKLFVGPILNLSRIFFVLKIK